MNADSGHGPDATALRSSSVCPLCGGSARPALTARDRNRAITEVPFHYSRCGTCSVVFLVDIPQDLAIYYPAGYYQLPRGEERARLEQSEQFKVDLLREHSPTGRLLEIGPGYGLFAGAARRAGFEVTGIEMDSQTCQHLRDSVGITAINSDRPQDVISKLPEQRVVALWHVLEHLPEPWEVLDRAAQRLERGGLLAVSTPSPDSLQFQLTRSRWPHLDAPRHLQLIPSAALIKRASALGLRLVRILSDDPAGLLCNRMGWELAVLNAPAERSPTFMTSAVATLAYRGLRPIERRPTRGSTYTAIFANRADP